MKSISSIKSRYYSIARQLKVAEAHVYFFTTPHHDGSAHIERIGDSYCYVVTERGKEYERRTTSDPDEVLYWLVSNLTFSMATEYELHHRAKDQDSRRIRFQKQLELLAKINGEWSQRKRAEFNQVLSAHQFSDGMD